jgi:hypothetical protein
MNIPVEERNLEITYTNHQDFMKIFKNFNENMFIRFYIKES